MVVAVVDEVVRDRVTVVRIKFLEQGLGDLSLLLLDLDEEGIGLIRAQGTEVVALEVHVLEIVKLSDLIRADRCLIGPAIRDVEGPIDLVRPHPRLRGRRYTSVPLGNTPMAAVDVSVREPGARNTDRGAAPRGPKGVVGSPPPDTERGAVLPEVPTNPREDFDTTTKSEEAHKR